MQSDIEIQCPFCGQSSTLMLDASVRLQTFTTDCEVCCRPMKVQAEAEAGEIVAIEVTGD